MLVYLPLTIFLIFTLFPFYWMLNTSFKVESSILNSDMSYLPIPFTTENYTKMITSMGFGQYFLNSFYVSIITTVVVMVIAMFGGYSLARYKFKGKTVTMALLLITQMLPGVINTIISSV